MKVKYFSGCLVALFLMSFGTLQAGSNLNILKYSGSETFVTASALRTITFSGSNLNLNFQNGNTEAIALSDIRKLFFSPVSSALETVQPDRLNVYPNPVSDRMYLKNIPEGATMATVWNICGRKMLRTTLSAETNSLNVSVLPSGLYLLVVQNQTIRFSKK